MVVSQLPVKVPEALWNPMACAPGLAPQPSAQAMTAAMGPVRRFNLHWLMSPPAAASTPWARCFSALVGGSESTTRPGEGASEMVCRGPPRLKTSLVARVSCAEPAARDSSGVSDLQNAVAYLLA